MAQTILDYYPQQIEVSATQIKRFEKLVNTFSFLRLFAILLGVLTPITRIVVFAILSVRKNIPTTLPIGTPFNSAIQ